MRLVGHRGPVESVAFSPAGAGLASGSGDGDLILWDPGAVSRISRTLTGVKAGENSMVSFSPDGKLLASGNSDGTVSFWNVATAKLVGEALAYHSKKVTSLAFSPDGTILASGSEDQTVVLLNVGSRQRIDQLQGHRGSVSYVGFSRDGKSLISSSQDADTQSHHTVLFWDVSSGTRRRDAFALRYKQCAGIRARRRAPCFRGGRGKEENVVLRAIASNGGVGQPKELKKDNLQVEHLVFSPDGKILASYAQFTSELKSENWLSNRPAILLWDTEGRQVSGALRDYEFSDVMSFSPNAKLLAVVAGEGTSLWDVATRKQIGALMEGQLQIWPLVRMAGHWPRFKTYRKIRDKGIEDRGVALWDLGTSELLGRLPAGDVRSLSFSPDGNTLLASSAWPASNLHSVGPRRQLVEGASLRPV